MYEVIKRIASLARARFGKESCKSSSARAHWMSTVLSMLSRHYSPELYPHQSKEEMLEEIFIYILKVHFCHQKLRVCTVSVILRENRWEMPVELNLDAYKETTL